MINKNMLILWGNIPNYIAASIRQLAKNGYNILIIEKQKYNFSNSVFRFNPEAKNITIINMEEQGVSTAKLMEAAINFNPAIVISALDYKGIFFEIAKAIKNERNIIIAATDHYIKNWKEDIKSVIKLRLLRKRLKVFNYWLVPGYRAKQFVKISGVKESAILEGLYSCDTSIFSPAGEKKNYAPESLNKRFIYVGTFSKRKGFDTLINAYKEYLKICKEPWELVLVGHGPLESIIPESPKIKYMGNRTQDEICKLYGEAGCFVISSRKDHWPLVLHEAACSGLPVIASRQCGNVNELVQDGCSGYLFNSEDRDHLVELLLKIPEYAAQFGARSYELSKKRNSNNWLNLAAYLENAHP